MDDDLTFSDADALLYRLTDALRATDKEVVFVVGAPLTAPYGGEAGVADVEGIVNLIRQEFISKPHRLAKFDATLANVENRYQAAFGFLTSHAGQDATNQIIRKAVLQAIASKQTSDTVEKGLIRLSDADLSHIDKDIGVWQLSPGVDALGGLIARFPERFGRIVLTSNFDPLIEIAAKRHHGDAWRTSLSSDGSLFQSDAAGTQVVHIHGYWHSSDTLHTQSQLLNHRPILMRDMLALLQDKLIVVLAYGGWPDIFTGVLANVLSNDNVQPEVLWGLHGDDPVIPPHLFGVLQPGIARGRVVLYKGIDCHSFLPELYHEWETDAPLEDLLQPINRPFRDIPAGLATDERPLFRLAPLDCDRPPNVEVWVGREKELRALETSPANVVVLCGLGGEGKSVLAAYYIESMEDQGTPYMVWDWRDCKEQSDRIRTQVSEVIIRLSNERFGTAALSELSDDDLVETFVAVTRSSRAIIVLDNVDSHVDLERRVFTGLLQSLVEAFSLAETSSRLLITCRPEVEYASASIATIDISGLSLDETVELFQKRAPSYTIDLAEIEEAHRQTLGHAFELDLIALQIANVPGTTIRKLLDNMRRGRGGRPEVLSSIWDRLPLREQTLLRYLAEAVRPETEETIQRFCAPKLTFKNFVRAFKSLIALNLVVVKQEQDAPDLYDLHPLVRHFVRSKYEREDRTGFIKGVLSQYETIIGVMGSLIGIQLPFSLLGRWSQKAELQVSAGLYEAAFDTLINVEDAMIGGGHLQEYVRVARILFESIDWETAPVKYKQFDRVVAIVAYALQQLGDDDAVDRLMDRYGETVPHKTARYINLCNVRAYVLWMRGKFSEAVEWAQKGDTLKEQSQVDTSFDCKHTLALSQRDAGNPEDALNYFVKDYSLEEILSEPPTGNIEATVYGNAGRCLHLMGKLDEALVCYKRSMRELEGQTLSTSQSNLAYGRRWTGQAFATKGDRELAEAFFLDAIHILGNSAPTRVRDLSADLATVCNESPFLPSYAAAARVVRNWMRQ